MGSLWLAVRNECLSEKAKILTDKSAALPISLFVSVSGISEES